MSDRYRCDPLRSCLDREDGHWDSCHNFVTVHPTCLPDRYVMSQMARAGQVDRTRDRLALAMDRLAARKEAPPPEVTFTVGEASLGISRQGQWFNVYAEATIVPGDRYAHIHDAVLDQDG